MDDTDLPEWMTGFYNALLEFLHARGITTAREIKGFEDYNESGGACPTCAHNEYYVDIEFVDDAGDVHTYVYEGHLSTLIRELTK